MDPDSWGNGRGDLYNAVFGMIHDPWYPDEWRIDSDNDGLSDGAELVYETGASNADTNNDGILDGPSLAAGIDPLAIDHDGDGIASSVEIAAGTDPFLADSDGDGVADNVDAYPLDPTRSAATPNGGDTTAPAIVVRKPTDAQLLP